MELVRLAFFPFLSFVALSVAAPTFAVGLNDTGQTLCYDGTGAVIVGCVAASDDGRYGRDAAATAGILTKTGAGAASFDFTKIANNSGMLPASASLGGAETDWACTLDNTTGLMWEVKTNDGGLRHKDWIYTWYNPNGLTNGGSSGSVGNTTSCSNSLGTNNCNTQNYITAVNAAALCGHDDWRLPTPHELRSIVHYGTANPTIDTNYFPNTPAVHFWSAPHYVQGGTAWVVHFQFGEDREGTKSVPLRVRLVRGGTPQTSGTCTAGNPNTNTLESTPTSDFTANGDGTVTHTKTGLMWKQCAEGLSGAGCATGSVMNKTWSQALSVAAAVNNENSGAGFANHNDWRLPNLKELHSIVETCGYGPSINQTVFPNTPASFFWSASSFGSDATGAWNVNFGYGLDSLYDKTTPNNVRLVRGGQCFDSFDAQNPKSCGAAAPDTKLPLPAGPNSFPGGGACYPLGNTKADPNPLFARPLGGGVVVDQFYLGLALSKLDGPADLYLVVQLPNDQKYVLNSTHHWVDFSATVPFMTGILGDLKLDDPSTNLFKTALSNISLGSYNLWLLLVPAGTDPANFDLATSPFYLWCFDKTL